MNLSDQEKVLCTSYVLKKDARYWWENVMMRRDVLVMTWNDFLDEFNKKYCDHMAMRAQHNEFDNLKQGNMSVTESCRKFDRLARLCPDLVPTERIRVRKMIKMFRSDIALVVDSGSQPPTTVADCVNRALRAEYHIAQSKEEKAKFWDAKKKEKTQNQQNKGNDQGAQANKLGRGSNQNNQNNNKRNGNFNNHKNQGNQLHKRNNNNIGNNNQPACVKCGKKHPGECRQGSNICYICGKEGHYARNCYSNKQNQQGPQRQQGNQLHNMQTMIDGPQISQGCLEAPSAPNAHILAYTRSDVVILWMKYDKHLFYHCTIDDIFKLMSSILLAYCEMSYVNAHQ